MKKQYNSLPKDDPTKANFTVEQYVNSTIRALLSTQISDAKSLVREDRKLETEEISLYQEQFRNMSPKIRKYAMTEFFKDGGVPADMLNIEDLNYLIEVGKSFKGAVSIK